MKLSNFHSRLPLIIIISAFGPYLYGDLGIRLEHIILYPSFIIFLLIFFVNKKLVIKDLLHLLLVWFIAILFMFTRTMLNRNSDLKFINILAEFDSFFQPIIIIFLMMIVLKRISLKDSEKKIVTASKLLIMMLALNTVWSIINIFIDFNFINIYFWGGENSVASRAMTNGRYSGIFNQPMEAGVIYSLGLFCWYYIIEKLKLFNLKYFILLLLLIVGGLLTVSKVFIFGGIGLFILSLLSSIRTRITMIKILISGIIISAPIISFLSNRWSGFEYLLRFFNSDQGGLELLTAGRFGGAESQQVQLFSGVWDKHPLVGMGFGVNEVYDSGFFLFFGIGGLVGLFLLGVILLILFKMFYKYRYVYKNKIESKFFLLIFFLIIGGSFGAPVLTLNRVGIIVWVFIGLISQYFYFSITEKKLQLI